MPDPGWSLNGLYKPACVHLCTTLRHTRPGMADRFVKDLRASVEYVKDNPEDRGKSAPLYGIANTIPDRGVVDDALSARWIGWYRLS